MDVWEGICPGNFSGYGVEQGSLQEAADVARNETAFQPNQHIWGPPSNMLSFSARVGARREMQTYLHTARPFICTPNLFTQTQTERFQIKLWKGLTPGRLLAKWQSSSLSAFRPLMVLEGTSPHAKEHWQGSKLAQYQKYLQGRKWKIWWSEKE